MDVGAKGQGSVESCSEENLDFELRALQTECRELTRCVSCVHPGVADRSYFIIRVALVPRSLKAEVSRRVGSKGSS